MVERTKFRAGMSRVATAVTVITTDGDAGRHGFTASAVCSVSDDPPTLIICMNRQTKSNTHFKDNGVLGVNILRPHHEKLSGLFAGGARSAAERFEAANWLVLSTGAPILVDSAAAFDCVIKQSIEIGSHTVFICSVIDMSLSETIEGLAYFSRSYHGIRTVESS